MKLMSLFIFMIISFSTAFAQNVEFRGEAGGNVKVIISGVKGGTHTVNYYVAAVDEDGGQSKPKFKFDAQTNSGSVTNTVYGLNNRDQVVVKILNYNGNGQHEVRTSKIYENLYQRSGGGSNDRDRNPPPRTCETSAVRTIQNVYLPTCGGQAYLKLTQQSVNCENVYRIDFDDAVLCDTVQFAYTSKSYQLQNGEGNFTPNADAVRASETCSGLSFTVYGSFGSESFVMKPSYCGTPRPDTGGSDESGDY
ncbi:MAG: hypothetical protein JNM93_12245 [Bacteriovoracaceae bacterium]|nr:hypothetical protein [Bacteriovoracaceae bacterium]